MSEHPQQTDRVLRDTRILTLRIWAVVGCIVIAAVIFNLMGILAPVIEFLAVGSIIAFVMSPITNWLEHHGVNRGIGSLIALIVVVAVLVGVVCILSPILFGQIMEVLSRLPEQLRVAGGDLNEMISHAKTLNNTPLKEYLDDNLSSLVAVASKYVSQIAAELGRGVFPLITNTASQLFVIFLGLVLAYWMACDYPRMHHEMHHHRSGEGDLVPLYGRHPFSLCRRLHARYGRDVHLRWFPRLYRFYDHRPSVCGAHGYLYRHHAFGSGRWSLGERSNRHGARFHVQPHVGVMDAHRDDGRAKRHRQRDFS